MDLDEENVTTKIENLRSRQQYLQWLLLNQNHPDNGSRLEQLSVDDNDALSSLRQQRDMLRDMLSQQEKVRALQGRQVALLAMERERQEHALAEQLPAACANTAQPSCEAADIDDSEEEKECDGNIKDPLNESAVSKELVQLRRRLDCLRSLHGNTEMACLTDSDVLSMSVVDDGDDRRVQLGNNMLKDKLLHMQFKKEALDQLVGDLQHNPSAKGSTSRDEDQLNDTDAHKYLQRLKGIRNRLSSIRNLMTYYQCANKFIHGEISDRTHDDEAEAIVPSAIESNSFRRVQQRLLEYGSNGADSMVNGGTGETAADSSSSSVGLGWSSTAAVVNDPEITARWSKLLSAKRELSRLQNMLTALNGDLSDNGGLDMSAASEQKQSSASSLLPAAAMSELQRKETYEMALAQQQHELRQLMIERENLHTIQDHLKNLHHLAGQDNDSVSSRGIKLSATSAANYSDGDTERDSGVRQRDTVTFQEPIATFVANEEVYDKMRHERLMREELLAKKRTINNMLLKDCGAAGLRRNEGRLVGSTDKQSFLNYCSDVNGGLLGTPSQDLATAATWADSSISNFEEDLNVTTAAPAEEEEEEQVAASTKGAAAVCHSRNFIPLRDDEVDTLNAAILQQNQLVQQLAAPQMMVTMQQCCQMLAQQQMTLSQLQIQVATIEGALTANGGSAATIIPNASRVLCNAGQQTDSFQSVGVVGLQPEPLSVESSAEEPTDSVDEQPLIESVSFETLRETIYSEVASFISQNERRPRYLIELFRELQLLSTDRLRQRALYTLQELINEHLSAHLETGSPYAPQPPWLRMRPRDCDDTAIVGKGCELDGEQTPSESLVTSSEFGDDNKVAGVRKSSEKLFEAMLRRTNCKKSYRSATGLSKNWQSRSSATAASSVAVQQSSWQELQRAAKIRDEDLVFRPLTTTSSSTESLELSSSLSHDTADGPFADSFLGSTAIHLDKAMQYLRDLETQQQQQQQQAEQYYGNSNSAATMEQEAQSGSSSRDSSTSVSDMSSSIPRINTRLLDEEIKAVIHFIIPLLKQRSSETCTPQLLMWVRDVTLCRIGNFTTRTPLAADNEYSERLEFDRFFMKQLTSLISDSLARFDSLRLQDCMEDMLVELSELLFNEMAFFKLINDLDTHRVVEDLQQLIMDETSIACVADYSQKNESDGGSSCSVINSVRKEDSGRCNGGDDKVNRMHLNVRTMQSEGQDSNDDIDNIDHDLDKVSSACAHVASLPFWRTRGSREPGINMLIFHAEFIGGPMLVGAIRDEI